VFRQRGAVHGDGDLQWLEAIAWTDVAVQTGRIPEIVGEVKLTASPSFSERTEHGRRKI